MDDLNIFNILIQSSPIAGGLITAFFLFYKIWQLLKMDNRVNEIGDMERQLRTDLHTEISELRKQIERYRSERNEFKINLDKIWQELVETKSTLIGIMSFCNINNPNCPHLEKYKQIENQVHTMENNLDRRKK